MADDTIAAIATPFGQGAIAIVRVSGPQAKAVASLVLGGFPLADALPRRQHLAEVVDGKGVRVDEVLVSAFDAPASYTGEDVVEISCHGGILVTREILALLLQAGARAAEPGEFTMRAFLNGKMDLTQAEAVMDLISAKTSLALRAANEQLEGRIGREMLALNDELIGILAHVEAFIDFPEEDIDPDTGEQLLQRIRAVTGKLDALLATADQGRILREGVRTVICGEPNVGKSSLLNLLLGFERAIVSDQPGTTRDTIEEVINLRGIPLRLVDTAGMRESEDAIEREGMARAKKQISGADLVLEVVDAARPRPGEFVSLARRGETKTHLLILNKLDLGVDASWRAHSDADAVAVSCLNGEGVNVLADRMFMILTQGAGEWSSDPVAINARHQACLAAARRYGEAAAEKLAAGESPEFVSLELRSCLDAVGEVAGKTGAEEILDAIFRTFCIGK